MSILNLLKLRSFKLVILILLTSKIPSGSGKIVKEELRKINLTLCQRVSIRITKRRWWETLTKSQGISLVTQSSTQKTTLTTFAKAHFAIATNLPTTRNSKEEALKLKKNIRKKPSEPILMSYTALTNLVEEHVRAAIIQFSMQTECKKSICSVFMLVQRN